LYGHKWNSFGIIYTHIGKIYKNWYYLTDNKFSFINVDFLMDTDLGYPEGYFSSFNFVLFENVLGVRRAKNNNIFEFSALYYFGIKHDEIKYLVFPHIRFVKTF